jgi:hypothetical protein
VPLAAQASLIPLGCTQTIAGRHTGVLNVAADQKLCLLIAVQDGAVNVSAGGSLSVIDSTVTGAVTLTGGFRTLEFCNSRTVRGAISATGDSVPSSSVPTASWAPSRVRPTRSTAR